MSCVALCDALDVVDQLECIFNEDEQKTVTHQESFKNRIKLSQKYREKTTVNWLVCTFHFNNLNNTLKLC